MYLVAIYAWAGHLHIGFHHKINMVSGPLARLTIIISTPWTLYTYDLQHGSSCKGYSLTVILLAKSPEAL